jgi:excisionase family DNA binding protein
MSQPHDAPLIEALEALVRRVVREELAAHLARPAPDPAGSGAAPTFVTVAEAARRLACHPKTVRAMVERGQLRAVKVGSALRVDLGSLEEAGGGERDGDGRVPPARAARRSPRRVVTGEFSRRVAEEGPEAP